MADTDVLGIVSLLLAAGGAAYLFRSRFVSQKQSESATHLLPSDPDPESRRADTVPPKLRPPDTPPNLRIPKAPKTPSAAPPSSGSPPPPPPPIDPANPLNLPPKSGGKSGEQQKKDFWSEQQQNNSTKPPPSSRRSTKGATVMMPNAPGLTPPPPSSSASVVATTSAAKSAGSPKPPPSAPASSQKPIPAPPSSAKVAKQPQQTTTTKQMSAVSAAAASPAPPPSSLPATKLGAKAKEEEEKARKKAEALKKQALIESEVPKIEVEEDEDVEPTKVGKVAVGRREIQPPVEKIVVDDGADAVPASGAAPVKDKVAIYSLAQTDPGKRRKQNEDSYLVIEKEQVFVVADGMGGHKGGQIASKLAVDTIKKAYDSKKFEAAPHKDLPTDASNLARALQMANASILEEAGRRPELKGMGTTICGMRFSSNCQRLYVAHVGDSRCYRIRDGVMKQLTSDHTMADYGVAGPEGAHLSRALGVWPTVPIDVLMLQPKLNDLYLLCSDGLTKMLPDGTIAAQLMNEEDPKAAVSRLVFFANAHGGKDNITIILLRIVEPGWKPPAGANPRSSKPEIA